MQDLRTPFSSPHRKSIVMEALIDRKDKRRPAEVRSLEDARKPSKGGFWDQAVQGVNEVVDERNAAPPAETDSRKSVEDAQTDQDVGPKFTNLAPNLEAV